MAEPAKAYSGALAVSTSTKYRYPNYLNRLWHEIKENLPSVSSVCTDHLTSRGVGPHGPDRGVVNPDFCY
jgi:hypothetical protein